MKIALEAAAIFLVCFAIALLSTMYALITRHLLLVKGLMGAGPSEQMMRDDLLSTIGLAVPFALFALGAVVQNQLHHDLLAPAASLLIAGVFITFPFAARIGWELIDQEWLDRRTRSLPWNRARKR